MSSYPNAEDTKRIEEEVMAEIRAALDLPPTSMISIPKLVTSPQESPREGSAAASSEDEEKSCGFDHEEEKQVPVKLKDGSSPIKRNCVASLDGSALDGSSTMNDSFMMRMASSSSIGGSSAGISESSSQRFYIGTVDEEEAGSVQSHVSNLGTDDMSQGELMEVVHRLYKQLKKTDITLSEEKKRRRSREKNLIKLARELGKRKEMTNMQMAKIEEMWGQLRVMKAEKTLLEQRLEVQKRASNDVRAATQRQVDLEVEEIVLRYQRKIEKHEQRVLELNNVHANQCEELCREVVEANQEVMRVQKVLSEMARGAYPVDRTFTSTVSREETLSSVSWTNRPARQLLTLLLLCGAICLGYNFRSFQPTIMEVTDRMNAYMETLAIQLNGTSHEDRGINEDTIDRIDPESEYIPIIDESGIKGAQLNDVFSSNFIPGMIFDPTLPLKLLQKTVLSKKGK